MFRPVVTAALALAIASGTAPATALASWGHPSSSVSGGMRVTWTSDSGDTNHGFPSVALAPSRPAIPRQDRDARFLLDFGSPTGICGQPLGTHRHPVLVPLRR